MKTLSFSNNKKTRKINGKRIRKVDNIEKKRISERCKLLEKHM
jgi:hypothetical protein